MKNTNGSGSDRFAAVTGILTMILGVLCMLSPDMDMSGLALYIGLLFLVFALLLFTACIIARDDRSMQPAHCLAGSLLLAAAIPLLVFQYTDGRYLLCIIGFLMIVYAVSDLLFLEAMAGHGRPVRRSRTVLTVFQLFLGFAFLLLPARIKEYLGLFTGLALMIPGLSMLIGSLKRKEN